jgi:hypothetical protein
MTSLEVSRGDISNHCYLGKKSGIPQCVASASFVSKEAFTTRIS